MSSTVEEQHNQIILSMLKKLACRMLDRTSDAAENVLNWKDNTITEILTADTTYRQDRYLEDTLYDQVWNDLYTQASLTFHLFDRAKVDISYHNLGKRRGVLVIYDDGYNGLEHVFVYPAKNGIVQIALDKDNNPL